VHELEETFDGQFLVIHAEVSTTSSGDDSVDTGLEELAAGFAETYRQKVEKWRGALEEARADGGRVVAWGAGSKGNTFLNLLGRDVSAIVDINPKKRGKFVAGTGQPIIAPGELTESPPSTVVIMNPAYRTEIAAELSRLGLQPRLLVA